MLHIVDLSEFNRVTSWPQLAGAVDGAIIRAGFRGWGSAGTITADARAREYLVHAKAQGLPLGIYFVSQAVTDAEAQAEADFCAKQADGIGLRLPVFFDSELAGGAGGSGRADRIDPARRTACALAFVRRCAEHGFRGGVYCSDAWLQGFLEPAPLLSAGVPLWLASYPASPGGAPVGPRHPWDAWQYTDHGTLPGVSGLVDLSRFEPALLQGTFSDTAGHWAEAAIDKVAAAGLMNGKSERTFAPNDVLTRAELAAVLARLLDKSEED